MASESHDGLLADVSAASAAYLVNLLPQLVNLPPREQFERLALHFEAALVAYSEGKRGAWPVVAEPPPN